MTFRELHEAMLEFVRDNPDHESLDQAVIVRLQTDEQSGDDLWIGGLRTISVDAGCTEVFALVLDADMSPDDEES